MFANHPVVKIAAPSADYPIGLSLEKFLYFFSRVESFDVSLSSFVEPLSTTSPSNIIEIINTISSNTGASYLSGSGFTTRVSFDGSANVISEYPRFSFSFGGCSIVIDFGLSITYFGLFYPWVKIEFSNGVSSVPAGRTVGAVSIMGGSVPLYSSDAISQISAFGEVKDGASFDLIKLKSSSKASAIFSGGSGFSRYIKASLGGLKCEPSFRGDSLVVSLHPDSKSGYIRFESDSPHSSFMSLDRIILS
jgi:hypothetical protein